MSTSMSASICRETSSTSKVFLTVAVCVHESGTPIWNVNFSMKRELYPFRYQNVVILHPGTSMSVSKRF